MRTLTTGSGPLDLEYHWHDTAVAWQTPELGEQLMTMFGGEIAIESLVAPASRGRTPPRRWPASTSA